MPPRRNRPAEESRRLSPDELDQVVRFRLADVVADDLSKKVSEPDAFKKALLVLIALTADGADETARRKDRVGRGRAVRVISRHG